MIRRITLIEPKMITCTSFQFVFRGWAASSLQQSCDRDMRRSAVHVQEGILARAWRPSCRNFHHTHPQRIRPPTISGKRDSSGFWRPTRRSSRRGVEHGDYCIMEKVKRSPAPCRALNTEGPFRCPGLVWKENGSSEKSPRSNRDLDSLPFPISAPGHGGMKRIGCKLEADNPAQTSRGCPSTARSAL